MLFLLGRALWLFAAGRVSRFVPANCLIIVLSCKTLQHAIGGRWGGVGGWRRKRERESCCLILVYMMSAVVCLFFLYPSLVDYGQWL